MEILTLLLTDIAVTDRLRVVDTDRAEQLARSMGETGQITPIEVAPADDGGKYRLIAGAHRVAAAELAGMTTILATVFEGSDDQARLREIDENLYRRELSPYDQAGFLAERRVVYERLFGRVKSGPPIAAKLAAIGFYDDVAAQFGLPERTIRRALARRKHICDAAWNLISGSFLAENGTTLDALMKVDEADQPAVVARLLEKTARTVWDALAQHKGSPAKAPSERRSLVAVFGRASIIEKEALIVHIVAQHGDMLRRISAAQARGRGQ